MQRLTLAVSFCTGVTLTCVSGANAAATDPIVFDNYPSGHDSLRIASVHETTFPYKIQTADDFTLASNMSITGVTWHGDADAFDASQLDFRILFYADNGGVPAGAGLSDPSTGALAAFDISAADIMVTSSATGEEYTADLGGMFNVTAGTIFWVSVVATIESDFFGPWWYWNLSSDLTGNEALVGGTTHGVQYWTPLENTSATITGPADVAFRLHGTAVPTPAAALALLGLAGAWGTRHRR